MSKAFHKTKTFWIDLKICKPILTSMHRNVEKFKSGPDCHWSNHIEGNYNGTKGVTQVENDTNLPFSFPGDHFEVSGCNEGKQTDCVRPCTILKVYTRGKLPEASNVLHTGVNASAIAQTNIKYPNMRLVPKISASLSPGTWRMK